MIVLDTHAWIWWAAGSRQLSTRARTAIEESGEIAVSPISVWEVGMLVARGRLTFDRDVHDWVRIALSLPKVWLAPLVPEIALGAAALGDGLPGDPADRLIAATASHHRATLISKDRRIRNSRALTVIW